MKYLDEKGLSQVWTKIKDKLSAYAKVEEVEEIAVNALGSETLPSPNLININDTESYPFGTSETEAVKGLYSWVDDEGYINIKGTTTENCSLYLMFDIGNVDFEPGTYHIGFDDVLRTSSDSTKGVAIQFNGVNIWVQANDAKPKATVDLASSLTVKKIDLYFNKGATIDFRGHCWMTKDEPFDFYVPKDGSYKVPITPAKKEDFIKLDDYNVLGIFNSIGGVGDSLTSGYINTTNDDIGVDTTCYPKSWLSELKKVTGVDITHYSYQGATAKNWMQNQNGFHDKIIETPHDAYFLGLGTNDSSDWSGYGLGTIADMGNNTESFYGWYSKVINRIRTANPKAPIFMLSMYWTGFPTYNQAIEEMANATENAYYIDITDMNEKYSQYRQGYHFNAIGYYYIAQDIVKRTSEVIIKNQQNFANLGITLDGKVPEPSKYVTEDELDGKGYLTESDKEEIIKEIKEGSSNNSVNQIPISINTDGSIYNNGIGYKTGYRLNSSGNETALAGTEVTGFIPVKRGDVVRFKNIDIKYGESSYANCYIHLYTSAFSQMSGAAAHNMESAVDKEASYIGGLLNVYGEPISKGQRIGQFTINQNGDVAYMRVSATIIDDTSAITINESSSQSLGLEDISNTLTEHSNRLDNLENQEDEDIEILDYVRTEAESVIDRVIEAQGSRTFTFAAITDLHYGHDGYTNGIKNACQALKYIDSRIKLDAVAVLGDYTDGFPSTGVANAISDFKEINNLLNELRFAPNLRQQGNHDYYENNFPVTHRLIQAYSDDVVWGDKIGGYYYKDFADYKLRIISLNTVEEYNSNVDCSEKQYEWFANSLDLSSKEDTSEWQILILSHHPLDWYSDDANSENNYWYRLPKIIYGYKNGLNSASASGYGSEFKPAFDFSKENNRAKIICNIHGHIHNLLTAKIYLNIGSTSAGDTGIYRIATPEACIGRANQYTGVWKEETSYPKTIDTVKDTSFVIYCIDLDTFTIKAICYGAGYDREISY